MDDFVGRLEEAHNYLRRIFEGCPLVLVVGRALDIKQPTSFEMYDVSSVGSANIARFLRDCADAHEKGEVDELTYSQEADKLPPLTPRSNRKKKDGKAP